MILFFYVVREYIKYLLSTIVLCSVLFVLFDFLGKTARYFSKYNPSSAQVIKLYIFQLPSIIYQAMPLAALLASVISMVLLSRSNEITAMRAAGMGPVAIGMPVAFGGLLTSFAALMLDQLVIPRTAEVQHRIEQVEIEKKEDQRLTAGSRWVKKKDRLFYFEDYDPFSATLSKVQVLKVSELFRPVELLTADTAVFSPPDKTWTLSGITLTSFHGNGTVDAVSHPPVMILEMPLEPKKLKQEYRMPSEMTIGELWENISRGEESGADVLAYRIEFHLKIAMFLASLVVSLIGIRFAFGSERSTETVRSILVAVGMGVSYWFILSAGRAMARNVIVPPFVGAWAANVVVAGIALVSIMQARKIR
jgi:lipopolysaccharide export system permease protein